MWSLKLGFLYEAWYEVGILSSIRDNCICMGEMKYLEAAFFLSIDFALPYFPVWHLFFWHQCVSSLEDDLRRDINGGCDLVGPP